MGVSAMSKQTDGKSTTATIKQVLEYDGEWPKRAVELLEHGRALRDEIGEKADEKKGKGGSGLLGRLSRIENELTDIVNEHELDGVRFNNVVFKISYQSGRTTVDMDVFKRELLLAGVELSVVRKAEETATNVGDAFVKREWKELKS
jgi:hypothetical protein